MDTATIDLFWRTMRVEDAASGVNWVAIGQEWPFTFAHYLVLDNGRLLRIAMLQPLVETGSSIGPGTLSFTWHRQDERGPIVLWGRAVACRTINGMKPTCHQFLESISYFRNHSFHFDIAGRGLFLGAFYWNIALIKKYEVVHSHLNAGSARALLEEYPHLHVEHLIDPYPGTFVKEHINREMQEAVEYMGWERPEWMQGSVVVFDWDHNGVRLRELAPPPGIPRA